MTNKSSFIQKYTERIASYFSHPAFLAFKVQNPLCDQPTGAGSHLHSAGGLAWHPRQPAAGGPSMLQLSATVIPAPRWHWWWGNSSAWALWKWLKQVWGGKWWRGDAIHIFLTHIKIFFESPCLYYIIIFKCVFVCPQLVCTSVPPPVHLPLSKEDKQKVGGRAKDRWEVMRLDWSLLQASP